MPLVFLALVAYLGGLLAGLTGHLLYGAAAGAIAVAGAIIRRRAGLALVGLLAAAAAGIGYGTAAADARCARDLVTRTAFAAELLDAAGPGAFVRAVPLEC